MGIKISDKAGKIQVVIDGDEYKLLERTARAMNRPKWTDDDNTALTVFRSWVWSWSCEYFEEEGELAASILDGVATSDDGLRSAPGKQHQQRLDELRKAFVAEGLLKEVRDVR